MHDVLDLDLLKRPVVIAVGANRQAKFWENRPGTVADILDLLTKFEVGKKDGKAILQGAMVENGERKKEAQHTNYFVMPLLHVRGVVRSFAHHLRPFFRARVKYTLAVRREQSRALDTALSSRTPHS